MDMWIWQLIAIQVVTLVFIILFLRWLLHNQITRAVKRLQKLNQQNLEKEKILREEIDRGKKEANLEIEKSKVQAAGIKEEAKIEADKIREGVLEKSKEEAKRFIEETAKDAKRKESEVILKMQNKSVHIAADMVKYVFTDKGLENLQAQLIDELIEDIKNLDEKRIDVKENKANIIYAHMAQAEQKEKLRAALCSKLGKDISLSEELDPEIIAGIIIKISGFVIDGSIKNKLRKALPIMAEKIRTDGDWHV